MKRVPENNEELGVTVIVPTYNRERFICESLDAVLAQLKDHDELIVIIDGSKDNTEKILATYAGEIRIIAQENTGKPIALNRALREAKGDLIWIVDDDDIVAPDARARLIDALKEHPEAGFSYGRHDRFYDDEETRQRHRLDTGYWFDCEPEEFLCATLEDFFAHQCGMMVRKSLYDEVGPFEDVFSEDYEMLIRLALATLPVQVPGIVFSQRQHSGVRGTASSPVKIEQRDAAWRTNSQALVKTFMDKLRLEYFVPGRQLSSDALRRQAFLQRAVIFGRHALWLEAAHACREAATCSDAPLTSKEVEILSRISFSKYEAASFLEANEAQQVFSKLAKQSASGKHITRTIGRSFVWRMREAFRSGESGLGSKYLRRVIQMWILGR